MALIPKKEAPEITPMPEIQAAQLGALRAEVNRFARLKFRG